MSPTAAAAAAASAAVRGVSKVVKGQPMSEGAGVRIVRTIGTGALRHLDPFLMLDELKLPAKGAAAGFPDHPHRGFETCSIMLEGKMEHRDSAGNHGVIGPGGVQWMTAGRGIVHSEMPAVTDGILHGFQLWVNLPAAQKMVKPRYQDIQAGEIPAVDLPGGASVRVMAGEVAGTAGPIKLRNPGALLDVRVPPGGGFAHAVPAEWNGLCYVYHGSGELGGAAAAEQHAYVLAPGGGEVRASAGGEGLKFLFISGKPIGEPIEQYGPFVMNHPHEIQQAFADYRSGKLQNPDDDVWSDEL